MDRINWVTHDSFNAVAQLSRLVPHGSFDPALAHGRMRAYLEATRRKAREAGFSEQDARHVTYALTALADEVVMEGTGPMRDYWASRPLQMLLFAENTAGESFFVHLEGIRQKSEQLEVLRVFYLCLLFGFRGKYAVRGSEMALGDLVESIRVQLSRQLPMPEVLAPNGPRPEEGLFDVSRRLPVVWMAVGLLALASVLYLGLSVSLREELGGFLRWMNQAIGA
jgi:type VI secretion system protein ImpK